MAEYERSIQAMYKKGIDGREARRKRTEVVVKIGKGKRLEMFEKRRRMDHDAMASPLETEAASSELGALFNVIVGGEQGQWLAATRRLRVLLMRSSGSPIQEVIDVPAVLDRIIKFTSVADMPELQLEAAWILTNLSAGTTAQTAAVVEAGAVPYLATLLTSPNDEVCAQSLWALGNVAGDSPDSRDLLLSSPDMVRYMVDKVATTQDLSVLRNGSWALSNLCLGTEPPPWQTIKVMLPLMAQLLFGPDEEVVTNATEALARMARCPDGAAVDIMALGVQRKLVELLIHPMSRIQDSALSTVISLLSGDDLQTEALLKVSVLSNLLILLCSQRTWVRKSACFAVSNITAGPRTHVQAVLDARIIHVLIAILRTDNFGVRREAAIAVGNAIAGGSTDQVHYMMNEGVFAPLMDILRSDDGPMLCTGLATLQHMLRSGDKEARETHRNPYVQLIEEAGVIDRLEQLQEHASADVYTVGPSHLLFPSSSPYSSSLARSWKHTSTLRRPMRPLMEASSIGPIRQGRRRRARPTRSGCRRRGPPRSRFDSN